MTRQKNNPHLPAAVHITAAVGAAALTASPAVVITAAWTSATDKLPAVTATAGEWEAAVKTAATTLKKPPLLAEFFVV